MQVHITNLNNMGGTPYLAQNGVMKVARKMGYKEMGLCYFELQPDFVNDLNHRMDGIIAPLHYGDCVIFQYPNFIGLNYEEFFIDKVKSYPGTKLVIFVEDIQKLLFNSEDWVLEWEIKLLNRADALILPSSDMRYFLIKNGLNSRIPVTYQTVWEMPFEKHYTKHEKLRRFLFSGDLSRFPTLNTYFGKTPIEFFQREAPARDNDSSFIWKGYVEPGNFMKEVSRGGFGLVWSDDQYFDSYYCMNQPHKLGFNLSCGIPVIVRKGSLHEKFVVEHGLGFAVSSLEEADYIIQNITDQEYDQLYANVATIQSILLNGGYTRRTLQDAVLLAAETSCKPAKTDYGWTKEMEAKNKNALFEHLISLCRDQELLIVESKNSCFDQNEILSVASAVSRISCPDSGAEDMVSAITNEICNWGNKKLVLLNMGELNLSLAQALKEQKLSLIDLNIFGKVLSKTSSEGDIDRFKDQIVSKIETRVQ